MNDHSHLGQAQGAGSERLARVVEALMEVLHHQQPTAQHLAVVAGQLRRPRVGAEHMFEKDPDNYPRTVSDERRHM